MELRFERITNKKQKKKISKINAFIKKDMERVNLEVPRICIHWSYKKFKQILGKKKIVHEVRGGQIFALINFSKKDTLEVCFNPNRLNEPFPTSFFRFAFLHELGHVLLYSQREVFVEDIPALRKVMHSFIRQNPQLKNEVSFLNYIMDEMSVDMNFIQYNPWSKEIFLTASTYMLKHYTKKDILTYYTETKRLCLLYILSASRFFIPIGLLVSPHIYSYNKLLGHFQRDKQSDLIAKMNHQITHFIFNLYHHRKTRKLAKDYQNLLLTIKKIRQNCFKSVPS